MAFACSALIFNLAIESLGKQLFKKSCLNTGITRKGGGGVQPLPKSFWSTFFNEHKIWAKWQRGGGQGPCQIIWSTFEGFVLLNYL
jgi:hypothetical protein